MGFFDADAHVDETEETWDYILPSDARYKPVLFDPPQGKGFMPRDARPHPVWYVSGSFRLKRHRDDEATGTTYQLRELYDVAGRVRHMDQLGADVQVLYPTMFIHPVTERPEVELAVHRAYNRWLADKTGQTNGRLRWAFLPYTLNIEQSVKEMRWAKEHGACGVMKKGVEYERVASDPYFFPLYEEAERLDLPICFHTGTYTTTSNAMDSAASMQWATVLQAFMSLADDRVPERFPRLRFGFIEAGASWIPHILKTLGMGGRRAKYQCDFQREFLQYNRFFVTCDTDDDVGFLVDNYGVGDNLMIGTDYSHGDLSGNLDAPKTILERGERGLLDRVVAQRIVSENARRFYGV